ncbi:hypothetical protein A2U01_0066674, partial [Trifolium medium]|nr:hypothetical protein [Trifolium medium]
MELYCNSDRKELGKAAMLIWVLWKNRNNWICNHEKDQGQQLGMKAMSLWYEWDAVQDAYSSGGQQAQQMH